MTARHSPSHDRLRIELAGWLADFDLRDCTRGRDYYDRGRVVALEFDVDPSVSAPNAYAVVQGNESYECTLVHHHREGWEGDCTCPVGIQCKHLYAAGTALLNQLTGDRISSAPAASITPQPANPRSDEASLVAQFTAARGAASRTQAALLPAQPPLALPQHSFQPRLFRPSSPAKPSARFAPLRGFQLLR